MKPTIICERCKRELPPSEIDLFSDLCWDCVSEVEDNKKEAARWDLEQMESAKQAGWNE